MIFLVAVVSVEPGFECSKMVGIVPGRGVAGLQPRIGGRRVFAQQIAPQGAWPPAISSSGSEFF